MNAIDNAVKSSLSGRVPIIIFVLSGTVWVICFTANAA